MKKRIFAVLLTLSLLLSCAPFALADEIAGEGATQMIATAAGTLGKGADYFGFSNNWCAQFIGWCARQVGVTSQLGTACSYPSDFAEYVLNHKTGHVYYFQNTYSSTNDKVGIYLRNNCSNEDNLYAKDRSNFQPAAGDLICFLWESSAEKYTWSHIGLVDKVESGKVYYYEGNSGSSWSTSTVKYSNRSLTDLAITCYIRPSYLNSGSASREANVITNENIEAAIAYAYNIKETDPWRFYDSEKQQTYCAAFVWRCYYSGAEIGNSSYATARQMGDALITNTDANPPRGAFVFWYDSNGPQTKAGHVALSLGDGNIIHAYSNVKVTSIATVNNSHYTYRGWGAPIAGYTLATATPAPTNVMVTTDKTVYTLGETVSFMPSGTNMDYYNYRVDKIENGATTTVFSAYDGYTGSINYYKPTAAGTYKITISAVSSGGYTDADCTFTVQLPKPIVSVTTEKAVYTSGEEVTIIPNCDNMTGFTYRIDCTADGATTTVRSNDNYCLGSFSFTPTAVGAYTVYLTAHNSAGDTDTSCTFTVVPLITTLTIYPFGGTYHGNTGSAFKYPGEAGSVTGVVTPVRDGYDFVCWLMDVNTNHDGQSLEPYGYPLFSDPMLSHSNADMEVYSYDTAGTVQLARVSKSSDCPTTSGSMVKIDATGQPGPGLGGFVQFSYPQLGHTYYHIILAKIPVGYTICSAHNVIPDGSSVEWLTPQEGTGEFETYICKLTYTSTGDVGSFGYIYLDGPAAPEGESVTWYVGYAEMFDGTDANPSGNLYTYGKADVNLIGAWRKHVEPHTHTYDRGVVTVAPTCTTTGVKTYTCTECGDAYGETLAALGHSFTNYVSDGNATCDQDGTKTAKCDRCPETKTVTDEGSFATVPHTWKVTDGEISERIHDGKRQQKKDTWYTCIVCGYRETVEGEWEDVDVPDPEPDPDAPTLTVVGGKARPGKTVTVALDLSNNSGIAGMRLSLAYDSALTLTSVTAGDALTGLTFTRAGDLTANPVTLFWDGQDGDTSNGTIVNLTFTVAEDAADGENPITVTYQSSEVYDGELENVALNVVNGSVTVKNYKLGDVNDDDEVNGKDITVLRRYFAGGYGVTINALAADVNGDGEANGKDITVLRRYFAGGYGITLD